MTWETVIGLEIHVQLETSTKLFCNCETNPAPPNQSVCPVCLGLPGALPVLNAHAVRLGVRASLGLQCRVHDESEFARKNYFYPDLPKGYQVSQFDRPLATEGCVILESGPEIRINRLHLEEDAGKSIHDRFDGRSALDYNRAGTPLAEIVTEPDIRTPEAAREFLVDLKRLLRYLDVSPCNMEEGQLRVDGNLSVRPLGQEALGTKQEVKNLNSFAAVERSLRQMQSEQIRTLEGGQPVQQATFSGATDTLVPMRSKEDSDDYRYFPEPDLPLVVLPSGLVDHERGQLPELAPARRARYRNELNVPDQQAEVLTDERARAEYFESVVQAGANPTAAAHWVTGPVLKDFNDAGLYRVPARDVATLINMVEDGTVSGQAARRIFAVVADQGGDPRETASELGLVQVERADLVAEWVEAAVNNNPDEWSRFLSGEDKLLGYFMGSVMKTSGGKAKPDAVRAALLGRKQKG